MTAEDLRAGIEVVANLASIVTGVIAVWAWLRFKSDDKSRLRKLEEYLKGEKGAGDTGRRTALHLIGNLGMTEAQIFEAARSSKNIRMVVGQDDDGIANRIFFEYTTGDEAADWKMTKGR